MRRRTREAAYATCALLAVAASRLALPCAAAGPDDMAGMKASIHALNSQITPVVEAVVRVSVGGGGRGWAVEQACSRFLPCFCACARPGRVGGVGRATCMAPTFDRRGTGVETA